MTPIYLTVVRRNMDDEVIGVFNRYAPAEARAKDWLADRPAIRSIVSAVQPEADTDPIYVDVWKCQPHGYADGYEIVYGEEVVQ